jgi:hypothetical protein
MVGRLCFFFGSERVVKSLNIMQTLGSGLVAQEELSEALNHFGTKILLSQTKNCLHSCSIEICFRAACDRGAAENNDNQD